jgi:hypothetical protein
MARYLILIVVLALIALPAACGGDVDVPDTGAIQETVDEAAAGAEGAAESAAEGAMDAAEGAKDAAESAVEGAADAAAGLTAALGGLGDYLAGWRGDVDGTMATLRELTDALNEQPELVDDAEWRAKMTGAIAALRTSGTDLKGKLGDGELPEAATELGAQMETMGGELESLADRYEAALESGTTEAFDEASAGLDGLGERLDTFGSSVGEMLGGVIDALNTDLADVVDLDLSAVAGQVVDALNADGLSGLMDHLSPNVSFALPGLPAFVGPASVAGYGAYLDALNAKWTFGECVTEGDSTTCAEASRSDDGLAAMGIEALRYGPFTLVYDETGHVVDVSAEPDPAAQAELDAALAEFEAWAEANRPDDWRELATLEFSPERAALEVELLNAWRGNQVEETSAEPGAAAETEVEEAGEGEEMPAALPATGRGTGR